jgi:hypothetical protein
VRGERDARRRRDTHSEFAGGAEPGRPAFGEALPRVGRQDGKGGEKGEWQKKGRNLEKSGKNEPTQDIDLVYEADPQTADVIKRWLAGLAARLVATDVFRQHVAIETRH